jgi:hypothetical protein
MSVRYPSPTPQRFVSNPPIQRALAVNTPLPEPPAPDVELPSLLMAPPQPAGYR